MTFKSRDLLDTSFAGGQAALNEPLDATLARWQVESLQLERAGLYNWLAQRIPGQRVLEIGCGFGASTAALIKKGKAVFALDNRMDCLEATRQKVPEATYGLADVHHYDERLVDDLQAFAPDAVVCWLAGAFGGASRIGAYGAFGGSDCVSLEDEGHGSANHGQND